MSETVEINKRINIVDESLINGVSVQTQLFVAINNDHFAYVLLDKEKNKFVALREYRFVYPYTLESRLGQLQSIRETDELLKENIFQTICVAVSTTKFTLIPAHFYQKEIERDMLAMVCNVTHEEAVYSDQLKYVDARIVYALDKNLLAEIGSWFDGAKLFFGATGLIESQLLFNKNATEKTLTVNVRMQDFDLLVTEANRLLFFNSFRYQTSEDFMYYILFTCEQLGLNPENIALKFTGDIEKTSAAYFISSKYIRNIYFAERSDIYQFSYGFDKLPSHFQYSLFSQPLCVS